MIHRIIGTTLPVLEFQLSPGESVVAVSGELSWMSHSIQLKTGTQLGGGGFLGVFKRVAGGGSLFMTEYSAQGESGLLAFATRVPGHILPVEVRPSQGRTGRRGGNLRPSSRRNHASPPRTRRNVRGQCSISNHPNSRYS